MQNLFEEQQNWLNTQQSFCDQLSAMGFVDEKKNLRLFKRFHGDIEKSILKLTEKKEKRIREPKVEIDVPEVMRKTKILYLDCNNLRYTNFKCRELLGKDQELLQKMLQTIFFWLNQPEQQLQEVHLIWDVYKQKNMENLKEQLPQQLLIDYHCLHNRATFHMLLGDQIVKFSVQSSRPKIADDLIVELCSGHKDRSEETTVVTSDRGLKDRLKLLNITSFIGNGKWWKLEENQ